MDLAAIEVRIGAASNTVDLWLEVGWWLPISVRALLGIMPALAASEACVVAMAILQHWLFAEGLVLADRLVVVVVAIVPGRLVFRCPWLPNTWLLHKLLMVVLLGFKLSLAIIIS